VLSPGVEQKMADFDIPCPLTETHEFGHFLLDPARGTQTLFILVAETRPPSQHIKY